MAKKKALINIRGASASGKTTVVRQFCERRGFIVKNIKTPFALLPVSVIDNGKIIVFGDYSANGNCLGADRFHGGKSDIVDLIIEVDNVFAPEAIIYEHMLSSHASKGTIEIAQVASAFGYGYFGVQLSVSEEKRYKNLLSRSGNEAGTKTFSKNNGERINRATERLKNAGLRVTTIDVENWDKDEMWRIAENAIDEALK